MTKNQYIVICMNGEPRTEHGWNEFNPNDNTPFFRGFLYFGPFEGEQHAKLWLETKHNNCHYESVHHVEPLTTATIRE